MAEEIFVFIGCWAECKSINTLWTNFLVKVSLTGNNLRIQSLSLDKISWLSVKLSDAILNIIMAPNIPDLLKIKSRIALSAGESTSRL